MLISIDYQDKRPIYEQINEKLKNLIVKGVLTENDKIPSVRNMAIELSINPNTIQRAYQELERDGYIYTVKGRGNFVSPKDGWKEDKVGMALTEFGDKAMELIHLGVPADRLHSEIDLRLKDIDDTDAGMGRGHINREENTDSGEVDKK